MISRRGFAFCLAFLDVLAGAGVVAHTDDGYWPGTGIHLISRRMQRSSFCDRPQAQLSTANFM